MKSLLQHASHSAMCALYETKTGGRILLKANIGTVKWNEMRYQRHQDSDRSRKCLQRKDIAGTLGRRRKFRLQMIFFASAAPMFLLLYQLLSV